MADERKTAMRKAITGNPRAGKVSMGLLAWPKRKCPKCGADV